MTQAKDDDSVLNRLIKTNHDRIYYKERTGLAGRGEFEVATQMADEIPRVTFILAANLMQQARLS